MQLTRRSFLTGVGATLVAAPAIVRAASLMPVRGVVMPVSPPTAAEIVGRYRYDTLTVAHILRCKAIMEANKVPDLDGGYVFCVGSRNYRVERNNEIKFLGDVLFPAVPLADWQKGDPFRR